MAARFSFKRFTSNQRLSEETLAYAADLYLDGRKVGSVRNDGRGGSDEIHFDPEHRAAIEAAVEAEWIEPEYMAEIRAQFPDRDETPPNLYGKLEDIAAALCGVEAEKKEAKRIEAWIRRTAKGYRAKGFPTVLVARNGDEVRIAGSKVLPTAEQFPTVLARFATKWGVPVEALAAI